MDESKANSAFQKLFSDADRNKINEITTKFINEPEPKPLDEKEKLHYIVCMLRSGLRVIDLEEDELNVLKTEYGEHWKNVI